MKDRDFDDDDDLPDPRPRRRNRDRPAKRRKASRGSWSVFLIGLVVFVGLLPVSAGLSYLTAMGGAWPVPVIGGVILLVVIAVIYGRWLTVGPPWGPVILQVHAAFVGVALLLLLWLWVGIRWGFATVHVDNFSSHNVILELDGRPWKTCSIDTMDKTQLRRGEYKLVVRSQQDGGELSQLTIKVDSLGNYVLNVLGAHTYYQGTVYYSKTPTVQPGEPSIEYIREQWFRAKVDHLFEFPPGSLHSSTRSTAHRTYLVRALPPGLKI
jgi:hypothetical protein